MQLNITTRHFALTGAIRDYVEERFAALDHLGADGSHGQVVLDHDSHHGGGEYLLKAHLHGLGDEMNVEMRSSNLYDGIDGIVDTLKLQIRRFHDRLQRKTLSAEAAG